MKPVKFYPDPTVLTGINDHFSQSELNFLPHMHLGNEEEMESSLWGDSSQLCFTAGEGHGRSVVWGLDY